MKTKIIIPGIILALVLFACYPIVSPIQPRTNPNDANSFCPVAEVDSFTATLAEVADPDPDLIELSWSPIKPDYEYKRDGYLVISKTGSAPVNVFDGRLIGPPTGPDDASISEPVDTNTDDDTIEGAQAGYVNYYGLFAFYTEEDNPPAIGTDENGNLINTEYYIFAGPMVASVGVPLERTIELPIAEEKTVRQTDAWEDDRLYTAKNTSDSLDSIAIITFDTTDIQGFQITDASLILTNKNTVMYDYANSFHLDSLTYNWNGTETFAIMRDITSTTIDIDNRITFNPAALPFGSKTTVQNAELTKIVQDWADGLPRYGLRIMVDFAAAPAMNFDWEINTSVDGISSQPTLSVTYMYYPE